jgi:hypothetical protein
MKRNSQTEGLQYRYVPPPEELRTSTVFGTQEVTQARCTKCKEIKNIGEYYHVGPIRAKVRKSWCTVCHNKDTTQRSKDAGYKTKEYRRARQATVELSEKRLREYTEDIMTLERFFE